MICTMNINSITSKNDSEALLYWQALTANFTNLVVISYIYNLATLDSGAGISVTNPRRANNYNLPLQTWRTPIVALFANVDEVLCIHFVDFGCINGKVRLYNKVGAISTLLSDK